MTGATPNYREPRTVLLPAPSLTREQGGGSSSLLAQLRCRFPRSSPRQTGRVLLPAPRSLLSKEKSEQRQTGWGPEDEHPPDQLALRVRESVRNSMRSSLNPCVRS